MSCYSPLKAYGRVNPATGKKDIVFTGVHDFDVYERDGILYREKMLIPCGQCIGCRLDYSRDWATRCVLEAMEHSSNYFITLTYDDEHLPLNHTSVIDNNTGELRDNFISPTLCPNDLTKFMKDLRAYLKYHFDYEGVRFFACGEYGSKTKRPHYHIILFNMIELPDLEFYKRNFDGDNLFNSKTLDNIWKKGYIVIGSVSYESCAYVARYMLKKHKGLHSVYYDENGLVPEFSRCSRRPGIARAYYDRRSDKIYSFDEICITGKDGKAKSVKPPSYYDRLFDHDDPDEMRRIKENRKSVAETNMEKVLAKTSLDLDSYLSLKKSNKLYQVEKLKRQL